MIPTLFKNWILATFLLTSLSVHSVDQKPLSDNQLNALYFFHVASLAVDKCGYEMNTELFVFVFDEYELTEAHTDPNGSYADEVGSINKQAEQFMNETSCEKMSELFGTNGKALPGILNTP